MTIRLSVQQVAWMAHVESVAQAMPGLVPVVKGNGYGFRRWNLLPMAAQLSDEVAVGTVFEARDIPDRVTPIVLTPVLVTPPRTLPPNAVLTVASPHHVMALTSAGWRGRVVVKLRSSMLRFGVPPTNLAALLADVNEAGFELHGFSIHPPLAGDEKSRLLDVTTWLNRLDPTVPVYVSHLGVAAYEQLREDHPERRFRVRLGTQLWHGDKSALHLAADVLGHHPVESNQRAGYRLTQVTGPGEIVLVGCGTAHGVGPLPDGRSPFHFQRQRLNMLEPPHMHTTMLFVARGRPLPGIGEWIDVQQPLTQVQVDLLQWIK